MCRLVLFIAITVIIIWMNLADKDFQRRHHEHWLSVCFFPGFNVQPSTSRKISFYSFEHQFKLNKTREQEQKLGFNLPLYRRTDEGRCLIWYRPTRNLFCRIYLQFYTSRKTIVTFHLPCDLTRMLEQPKGCALESYNVIIYLCIDVVM